MNLILANKSTLLIYSQCRFNSFLCVFINFFVLPETRDEMKDSLKNLQGIWFALAFTSIGLETNFKDLLSNNSRKPLYAFLIAQLFNVIITLIIAFLLFGK